MTTYLRDVIHIPERTGTEDYVLRLTDGVGPDRVQQTLRDYVVTASLQEAFDRALGLVASAIEDRTSRAAFLRGSFGSGKSHFMAVLHALLRHDPDARAVPQLQPVLGKHDAALRDRRILPLAFHLLGARTLEEALLGGYVRQVQQLHPDAPLPAVHQSDGILRDGEAMRKRLGEESFFAALGGGAATDVWSGLLGAAAWDRTRYDAARAAAAGTKERQELVTALAARFFSAYTAQADYLDIDHGLAAIAVHAKALGYDAVVLLLDELVLWLAFGVKDTEFFRREAQKLTKLVESALGARALPIISFVARQLDLRQWFADAGATGAEQQALDNAFRHQEGRFTTLVLGDNNLPYVANQRLLKPVDANAARVLEQAFGALERRREVWDVLLDGVHTDERHRGADEQAFRLTYPFSPALISTLRSLASVMQRERTALKVMQQMLVDRREQLTVDDVIPVGDAFDYVVQGKEALDPQAAALFKAATALYTDKLRPVILAEHGTDARTVDLDPAKAPAALLADERLAKTLLLAAVAPQVPALKQLTASRLAALNHGSITSPLPGREAGIVLGKVRNWSSRVPEISLSEDPRQPVITVQLADVDYESVVIKARGEDNEGRQRELLRALVRDALGVTETQPDIYGAAAHPFVWRGSAREVDLVFGNVRDATWLSEDHFRARPGTWRVVIDHPFDDAGHGATDDLERLDGLLAAGLQTHTIVWLPRFLSEERMRELSRLVVLDWLLGGTGDRWGSYSDHLSEGDRGTARSILDQQRAGLRDRLRRSVQEAYGAAAPTPGNIVADDGHDRVLVSLDRAFDAARPVGADLGAAFRELLDRAFASVAPAHPRFEPAQLPITVRELALTHSYVERAVADPGGRVLLERADRDAVRRVSGPLGVGNAGETHFSFGDDRFSPWGAELERAMTRTGLAPHDDVTVEQVRGWVESVTPALGLREEVADLIILAWASLRQRAWFLHGAPLPAPRPGSLRPETVLRPQPLPTVGEWDRMVERAGPLFGIVVSNRYLTAANVNDVAGRVREAAGGISTDLVAQVEAAYARLALSGDAGRLASARAGENLRVHVQSASTPVTLVELLARTELPATDQAIGSSRSSASAVAAALRAWRWERLDPLLSASGARKRSADEVLDRLRAVVVADEMSSRLTEGLRRADDDVFAWLASPQGPVESAAPTSHGPSGTRSHVLLPGGSAQEVLAPLTTFLSAHPGERVVVRWQVGGGS